MAADMAETRSSSMFAGIDEAMLRPSTLTIAAASTSAEVACRSRKRSTNCSVRDLANANLLNYARDAPIASYSWSEAVPQWLYAVVGSKTAHLKAYSSTAV